MAGSRTRAVLFDIDGTLISSGGASDRAWKRAFEELQGVEVDVPAVTGKGVPDPEVGRVVFEKAIGREPTEEEAEALIRRRLDHLPEEVESSPGFVVKDGVLELLDDRLIQDGITLGLTTGNVEEAAHIKLARPNLNRYFAYAARGPIHRIARSSPGRRSRGASSSRGTPSTGTVPLPVATPLGTWTPATAPASGWWELRPASTRPRSWSRPAPTRRSNPS